MNNGATEQRNIRTKEQRNKGIKEQRNKKFIQLGPA